MGASRTVSRGHQEGMQVEEWRPDDVPEANPAEGNETAAESEHLDYGQALVELKPGDIVTGRVVQTSADQVLVDVGYKSEGVVTLPELSYRHLDQATDVAAVGDEITVQVMSVDNDEGVLRLSKRRADEAKAWGALEEAFKEGRTLQVKVVEAVKGGLVADVGTRGFIPASQVERGYTSDLGQYVGQELAVRIIELDLSKHRVILSRKIVLEEERKVLREETWAKIEEGQRLSGTVKSLTDFGAFIDLGGVDGLLHVSEMSWGRVANPRDVLSEGQRVDVVVLRLDREHGRISLGLKQVLPNPWDDVEERFAVGTEHLGSVVRLATFGAFVELEPGVDGLIHVSQLADYPVSRPGDVVSVGDRVAVEVLRVDPKEHRVSLSLRRIEQRAADSKREPTQESQ